MSATLQNKKPGEGSEAQIIESIRTSETEGKQEMLFTHRETMKGTPCLLRALMETASLTKHLSVRSAEVRSDFVGCVSKRPKLMIVSDQ